MKTILITGGVRGIGRSIALKFKQKDFRVCAVYSRDEENAKSLAALGIEVYKADVSKEDEVKSLFKRRGEIALQKYRHGGRACQQRGHFLNQANSRYFLRGIRACNVRERRRRLPLFA